MRPSTTMYCEGSYKRGRQAVWARSGVRCSVCHADPDVISDDRYPLGHVNPAKYRLMAHYPKAAS